MDTLAQDIRFALRTIWRHPGYTSLVIAVLALGIGATSAMFAVVRGALLADPPFDDPERVMALYAPQPEVARAPFSGPDFRDWREQSTSFEAMALLEPASFNLMLADEPQRLSGLQVSGRYFDVVGGRAALGRLLGPEDDALGRRVVVLSHGLFETGFGSDPAVIGRTLVIDAEPHEIVGVLAPEDALIGPDTISELATPLGLDASNPPKAMTERGHHRYRALAKLAPGVTREAAQSDVSAIAARLSEAFPQTNARVTAEVVPLVEVLLRQSRENLLLLFGAILFVLLLVCANAANLLLARGAARQAEIAMRASLGATRGRLIRQLVTESVVLALVAGGLGVLVAMWALDLFLSVLGESLPLTAQIELDPLSLAFTFVVAAATGVGSGLLPALSATRADPYAAVKEGATRTTGRKSRLRNALVIAEVAIAITLLSGAGMLLHSYATLSGVDPGFEPDRVHTARVSLPAARYGDHAARARFAERVVDELRRTPGVERAGVLSRLPMTGMNTNGDIIIEGRPTLPMGESPLVERRLATPDAFHVLSIRLSKGRAFNDADLASGAPVMIVNEAFARTFFPGDDPIGKRARWDTDELPLAEIVGVIADVRGEPGQPPRLESYLPFAQQSDSFFAFAIKLGPGQNGGELLRHAVRAVDPTQPVYGVASMDDLAAKQLSGRRATMILLVMFALTAVFLAALGIFGVVSHQTSQRTRELGIRLALGARPRDVIAMVVGQSMTVVAIGIAAGLLLALAGSRFVTAFVHGSSALDIGVYLGVALLVAVTGLCASYAPARRAAMVAPSTALRYE